MARLNWNRPRRIHTPWYDDPTRDIPGIDAPIGPRHNNAAAKRSLGKDDAFFSMLEVRVDQYDPPVHRARPAASRMDEAKASLLTAKSAVVHADGGCSPNPGTGGWGVTIDADGRKPILLWGGIAETTNNRMELTAAIVALSVLPTTCEVSVFSDSQYLIKGMTAWLAGWKRKGYRKGDGLIPNADLWKQLDGLQAGRSIRWEWVRGHNGHAGNERADKLAARGMREVRGLR
ncbi:ribonuclease HI [Tardiphaga sp. 367_B4_N1_1]|uniref:ribonuclease HI n=1 Tax=Tardiphaga sp. 367_B4_N1_1 TaxID=3240777 RepID=UPI003F27DD23